MGIPVVRSAEVDCRSAEVDCRSAEPLVGRSEPLVRSFQLLIWRFQLLVVLTAVGFIVVRVFDASRYFLFASST